MLPRNTVAAAVMLIITSAEASAQGDGYKLIFGQGIVSCGAWTQARQSNPQRAGLSAQWIAGFLSGINKESDAVDFLEGSDFDGITAWIDNYCKSKPLETIGTAAGQLMLELRQRAQTRR